MTSVHRERVKNGANLGTQSRKHQPIILLIMISVDIGVLANFRYLILKPVSANNVPIILCFHST